MPGEQEVIDRRADDCAALRTENGGKFVGQRGLARGVLGPFDIRPGGHMSVPRSECESRPKSPMREPSRKLSQ